MRGGTAATPLAALIALLWTLHPLLTGSVTYLAQRAESLVGLMFLLTLYGFLRGLDATESGRPKRAWYALAALACLFGVLTKEVMATAPLVVLLYDRTFVARSFASALRARRGLYAALFASWLPLAWLVRAAGGRGGSVGIGTDLAPWDYLLIQCWAIVRYLGLAFWPHPLVFDYGVDLSFGPGDVWPQGVLLLALLAGTLLALRRRAAIGFAGAFVFLVLGPSSSVIPVLSEPAAEHRMYLPLAAILAALVLAAYAWLGRAVLPLGLAWAAALGWTTHARNEDYRTELGIWDDTVAKRPNSSRGLNNLGGALLESDRHQDAIRCFEAALAIAPDYPSACTNLGTALTELGRPHEAIPWFERALRLDPRDATAEYNYGRALARSNRFDEAIPRFRAAMALAPGLVMAEYNLGYVLFRLGRLDEARVHMESALRQRPDSPEIQNGVGAVYLSTGEFRRARAYFEEALRLEPDYAGAKANLQLALRAGG